MKIRLNGMRLPLLMLSLGTLIALWTASSFAPAAEAGHVTKCFGERAGINRSHDSLGSFIVGTAGHNVIIASLSGDHVEGRGGRDFICGIGDNDEILGGRNADKLSGGQGNDAIAGGTGADLLLGRVGRDVLAGGYGNDVLRGGIGRDRGRGGPGRDVCVNIEVRRSCEVVR